MKKGSKKSGKLNICLELFRIFFKVGTITFGGGYIMLPYIYRELVLRRKWFSNNEIVDIFTVSQSIPGAISVNAAFNTGFRKAGLHGGLVSVFGIVLPAFAAILIVLLFFFTIREAVWARKFLGGILTASTALIILTTIDLAKTVFKKARAVRILVSLIVFIGVGAFNINALWMILGGIVFGLSHYFITIKKDKGGNDDEEND